MQHLLLIIISMIIISSSYLTNLDFLLSHITHFYRSIILPFFVLGSFSIFFTLQTLRKHCFINRLKSLIKLMKFLEFWYFLLYHHILFNTIFTETNSLWLIHKLVKALEIKNFVLFKFKFILLYVFLIFLLINLYFLITIAIAQILIPTADSKIRTGISTK